jgi:Flp pilus assembly protein TadD
MQNHRYLIFCTIVGMVPYLPVITYRSFVMDDAVAVQRNPSVIAPSVSLNDLFKRDFWGLELFAGTWTHKSFRPLTTWTYRLGYLLHGLDSSGFHTVSFILHAICSFLVGWLGSRIFRASEAVAGLCCLLFAAHPTHTENVVYLVGRADILASIFFMLAIWASHKDLHVMIVVVVTVLAGFSKEIGFMAPLVAAAVETVRQRTLFTRRFLTLFACSVLLMLWRHRYTDGTEVNMSVQDNPFSFETNRQTRWLSFAYVHAKYLQLLLVPLELCYDYSLNAIPVVRSFSDIRFLFTLTAYGIVLSSCQWVFGRLGRQPGCKLGQGCLISLFLILIPFLPASNILFPVGTVVGERLLYTPSIGFVFLLGILVEHSPNLFKRLIWLVVVYYLIRTGFRVQDWRDGDTLFKSDGHRQQASSKTQFNLGITYMSQKDYDRAVAALIRCAAADPMSALPYWRIGQIEILRGNFTSAEAWLMEASTKFSATLMIKDEEIFHDIAVAVFQNKKIDRADFYMTLALEINPRFPKGLNNMGCLVASRDPHRSVALIRKAVEARPDNSLYLSNLEFMAAYVGDRDATEFAKSIRKQLSNLPSSNRRDCIWEFVPAS